MRARVIDVSDRVVYLEVDRQLRFKTPYLAGRAATRLERKDDVDFDFAVHDGRACVIIKNVVHRQLKA